MAGKSDKNPNAGHRARLRARFAETGFKGFAPHEVLELLLTFGIPRRDVKPIAKALLARFGSVSGVLDADPADLQQTEGVGEAAAYMLRVVPAVAEYYLGEQTKSKVVLNDASVVTQYLSMAMSGLSEEVLWVITLNREYAMLGADEVARGTATRAEVSFRKVIEVCIRDNASAVILAHNHPGGTAYPSNEDVVLTERLKPLLAEIDVMLVDHVIVAAKQTISMRSLGLLSESAAPTLAMAAQPPMKKA